MYHVSAQGVDERMINVHYYYYLGTQRNGEEGTLLHKTTNLVFVLVAKHISFQGPWAYFVSLH